MQKKLLVFVLLIIFSVLTIGSMLHNSATSDEVTHITSGYSYWKYFDYTFNPEHPPLVKLWATIPLIVIDPVLPDKPSSWEGDQWDYAKTFLYKSGNNADQIYFWSRIMIVLIGILLGYYVYRWASELFGWKAGLLALVFYVFDPNILAHSTIVHTDIPISAAIFITLYYFWKYTQKSEATWKQWSLLGILVGLCLATKFTGIYVIPFLVILYFVHLFFDKYDGQGDVYTRIEGFYKHFIEGEGKKEFKNGITAFCIIIAVGIIILILSYGIVNVKSFFTGLSMVFSQSLGDRAGYLLGMNSVQGWWYYFIVAFFVKTPASTLIVLFAALFLFFKTKHDNKKIRNALFLLIPAVLYFIAFLPSKYNIGHRHILPIYPFLFVFMSSIISVDLESLGDKFARYKKYAKIVLLFLIALLIMGTVFAYPYFIPYFNELIGGSENGHKYLLDSNLDWGQGLKETAQWIDENGYDDTVIRMSYFGNEEPEYRGIKYQKIMCGPTPGIHVISANKLYDFMGNQYGCVDWLFDYDPVTVIGHSIYIYNINDPYIIEKDDLCKQNCKEGCNSRGEQYGDSMYKSAEDSCLCLCAEASNEDLGIL